MSRVGMEVVVSACLALAGGFALGETAEIVVRNGGMAQGRASVAEWQGGVRDEKVFKKGPASLRIDGKGTAVQRIDGLAGKTIRIAGWIKTAGDAKAQVAVQSFAKGWSQNKWQQVVYRQNDSDWSAFEGAVTLPEWTEWSELKLFVEGESGHAWIDEVRDAAGDVDPGRRVSENDEIRTAEPPKGKPWEPTWCIYGWRPAWAAMHENFCARTKKGGIDVVALGDSITQGWGERMPAFVRKVDPKLVGVNYGIGGDSTRQVLWRIQHGEVDGISPKLVILAIGTNNLYGDQNGGSEEEIARGVAEIVKVLKEKLPKSKILLLSVLPRQNAYFCNRIYELNRRMQKLAEPGRVIWHDRTDLFQRAPCEIKAVLFVGDRLHLKESSYDVWEADLAPVVRSILAK